MKKKVDERIRTLIKNGVNARHRSMFVIVGDKGLDRIVDLHHMLKNSLVKSRTNVLWCYKEKLDFSSNKKKRAMQVKKKRQRGLLDLEKDFEALTPNLLARTIETVAGGGLIILLLCSLFLLTSLKTMAMDVHERFRTESYPQDSGRFNERFLLSLGSCKTCIVMDDEQNILPISSHTKIIAPVSVREQLEEQNQLSSTSSVNAASGGLLKKTKLSESVRHASGDPIESWLHPLLCLDVINSVPSISRLPLPCECDLYHVNRDTLFSYHKDSELFLQRMMALYVASHYKNSPDDLQLIADAPAHHLFVLLGPVDESKNHLPEILCVIQICFEGQISSKYVTKCLSEGRQPSGNHITWKFHEQFGDTVFQSLSGARIVRIATHPSAMRHGYGSAAVELLARYFEGQLTPISELDVEEVPENTQVRLTEAAEKASLLKENIKPRTDLPPLLVPLRERRPEKLHYLEVSFGLTLDLLKFWRKHNFAPFYIGRVPRSETRELTCMVLKPLNNDDIETSGSDKLGFFSQFYQEFKKMFTTYLGRPTFRQMEYNLAMSFTCVIVNHFGILQTEHFVGDLACAYFWGKIPVSLSKVEASVLLCFGLQGKDISCIEKEMKLERHQILSEYKKVMKKFHKYLKTVASNDTRATASRLNDITMEPHPVSVDEELDNAAKQVQDDEMKAKLDLLQQYAIVVKEDDFDKDKALQNGGAKVFSGGVISIKSSESKTQTEDQKSEKKRNKHDRHSKTNKRRKP